MLLSACGSSGGGGATAAATKALTAIEITPYVSEIAAGTTQQYTATGVYDDGSTEDLTAQIVWSSSPINVATISNTSGSHAILTALSAGGVTVAAVDLASGIIGSTTLTVTAAPLYQIEIMPTETTIAEGTSRQFTAIGHFGDSSIQDLTSQVSWSSSDENVATINTVGSMSAIASNPTPVTVTASYLGVQGNITVTVVSAILTTIEITPIAPDMAVGSTRLFKATGIFDNGTVQDLTTQVAWSLSDPSIASISNIDGSRGLVTALAAGSTTVSADLAGFVVSGSTQLTVKAIDLTAIEINPVNSIIAKGSDQSYTATGHYSDGTTQDITSQVTWASSTTGVAVISNAAGDRGTAVTLSAGATTVTANLGSVSGSTMLTVTPAILQMIDVAPKAASMAVGTSRQYTATGHYTDGSTMDLTNQVSWIVSPAGNASVSNMAGSQGKVTALTVGQLAIGASLDGVFGTTSFDITTAVLTSIAVTPADSSLVQGTEQQFTATGTYSDASSQDVTLQVVWSSSDDGIAAISNADGTKGRVKGLASGGAITISALLSGISGDTTLIVTTPTLESIQVAPSNTSIIAGTTQQYTATGSYSDSTTQIITEEVVWSTADSNVAIISNANSSQGLLTGTGAGSTMVLAKLGGIKGSAAITVTEDPDVPVSLSITASPDMILDDDTDSSTLAVRVHPASLTGTIVDGTQINFSIINGSGALSSGSVNTISGQASATLTSATPGPVTIQAMVDGTAIANTATINVVSDFSEAFTQDADNGAIMDGITAKIGSTFGFDIINTSNKTFLLDKYEFTNGGAAVNTITDPAILSDGELVSGERIKVTFAILQLANELDEVAPDGFVAIFYLRDAVSNQPFTISASY